MSNPIKITFLKKIWWIAMISDQLLSRTELKILQQSDDNKLMMDNPMADLLKWHHHLGHEPFKTIHLLAAVNILIRYIIKAHMSVDQMKLSLPRFVAQMKGRLTKRRCIYNVIHRSPLWPMTHPSPRVNNFIANSGSKNIIWSLHMKTWCQS